MKIKYSLRRRRTTNNQQQNHQFWCKIRSDRELFLFLTLATSSLGLLMSHWSYHRERQITTTNNNHENHIAPSHLFENQSKWKPKQQQQQRNKHAEGLILDLGHPVEVVSPSKVKVSTSSLTNTLSATSKVHSIVASSSFSVDEKGSVASFNGEDHSSLSPYSGSGKSKTSNSGNDDDRTTTKNDRKRRSGPPADNQDNDLTPATVVWNQRLYLPNVTVAASNFIVNVGLPRSGEDTIYNFFHNLGFVTQYGCGDMKKPRPGCMPLGACIKRNVAGRPPQIRRDILEGCSRPKLQPGHWTAKAVDRSEFQVLTQLHTDRFLVIKKPVKVGLIMPQISYLEQLYHFAPNATWLLPLHPPEHWAYTISRHHTLRNKIWAELAVQESGAHVPVTRLGIFRPELDEIPAVTFWQSFYERHTQRIRDFAKEHPTLRVIELEYRRPRAPLDLFAALAGRGDGATLLPVPNPHVKTPNHVLAQWECMRNECDFWDEELKIINHYKVTPRPQTLKLPKPIFVVSFPKSGTTSVFNFFSCAGALSQHYCCCGDVADHRPCYSQVMAECILDNRENGRPMLHGCGDYDLYAQIDGERIYYGENGKIEDKKAGYYLPQVFELEQIHKEYPNATFILPLRDSEDWAQSVGRWFNMRHRIKTEYMLMNRSEDVEVDRPLINIYEKHTENVVDFVKKYPSHKLIKFNLSQHDAGRILAEASGLPQKCWGHHNKNTRSRKY